MSLNCQFGCNLLTFACGLQEIQTLRALAEIQNTLAFVTAFINLATHEIVNFHVPLAYAKVKIKLAVGRIRIDLTFLIFSLVNITICFTEVLPSP